MSNAALLPLVGALLGLIAFAVGVMAARRVLGRAKQRARTLLSDTRQEAQNKSKEILVSAQEKLLSLQEEADQRDRKLDERESALSQRSRKLEQQSSELGRQRNRLERHIAEAERQEKQAVAEATRARESREQAARELERVAGLTREKARDEVVAAIEKEARKEAGRLLRKIEEQSRESAERRALDLMIQAAERVNVKDVVETTVSFIELPSDEMKGRIIGREGRNIRALELATGIDLIVDDTPRSILISCFDPLRREVARVAIDRLVEDGRIHPARIEEVVQKVRGEVEEIVEQRGREAAYELGISDLHPRLVQLVGRMRYRTLHGQNLLQHCRETALIAAHIAQVVGADVGIAIRAGLLHELGQVDDHRNGHPIMHAADLCAKYREAEPVVDSIRSLHPDIEPQGLDAWLLTTANRISDNRPGARKDNLAAFVERLRRLEQIAGGFSGVEQAYAVKAGKELRVIVDASQVEDRRAQELSKEIARALEKELSYPGQIRVCVIRETRAVRYAV